MGSGVAALVGGGALGGRRFTLESDVTLIGRGEDCAVRVDDPLASRRHALIRREPWRYVLEDLGSRNGTLVNGEAILEAYHLQHGDTIHVATVPLRFEDPNATLPMSRESLQPLHLPVWVNKTTGEAFARGTPLELAPKEMALLTLLYDKGGAICEKDEIARAVWPEYQGAVSDYNIETLVSRLRSKLTQAGGSGDAIVTLKKRGYRLRVDAP
ncbi:MAG TPA: FHA domain-containing protein [Chloroflexota bacterium]|nr:FHA domain-containing protein [Chloroflexota bacterium]